MMQELSTALNRDSSLSLCCRAALLVLQGQYQVPEIILEVMEDWSKRNEAYLRNNQIQNSILNTSSRALLLNRRWESKRTMEITH